MPGVGNPRLLREATAMANTMRQHYPGLVILPAHDPGAPTSLRTPPYPMIPPPSIPKPQMERLPDPRLTGHSGGHEPPARTAPPPRGCKPVSRTPSPPPPASAPSRRLSRDPCAERSALRRRSVTTSLSRSRTSPGSRPSPQKRRRSRDTPVKQEDPMRIRIIGHLVRAGEVDR